MAIVNGNYVPDFGSMSNWGRPQTSSLTNQLGFNTNTQGTGFGQAGFNANSLTPTAGQGNSWLNNLTGSAFDTKDLSGNLQQGWLSPAIGAASGLAQSWLGFQGLGLAKDQLNFQKDAWNQQFGLQKEEYEYQKQRRQQRVDNYNASLNRSPAASPSNQTSL